MTDLIYIYALCEPATGEIRYVGKTKNLRKRYREHCLVSVTKRSHLGHWLRSVAPHGGPDVVVLDTCDESNWQTRECMWIDFYSDRCRLTNRAKGGQGGGSTGRPAGFRHSAETRAKMSEAAKNSTVVRKLTPEHVAALHSPQSHAKRSAALTGRKHTAEHRAAISAGHALYWTPERRAAWSEEMKARTYKRTAEHRAAISARTLGKALSPEAKAKLRAAKLGGKASLETRAKQSAAATGHPVSPETRAKIAAAMREREARKRAERLADS